MTNLNLQNFQNGLEYVVNSVLRGDHKPIIVSVVGPPNSGKSELRLRSHRRLSSSGQHGWVGMRGDTLDRFPKYDGELDYFIFEDVGGYTLGDSYSLENFGKTPNLRVYITKQFILETLPSLMIKDIEEGIYELIIENPVAVNKKLY